MKAIKLTFDLMCEKKMPGAVPYRIYINGELMTERDYVWDNASFYVREVVPVYLKAGLNVINIENLDPGNGQFTINNLILDGIEKRLFNGREFKV